MKTVPYCLFPPRSPILRQQPLTLRENLGNLTKNMPIFPSFYRPIQYRAAQYYLRNKLEPLYMKSYLRKSQH